MKENNKPWIIVDIDGVIANHHHREYFLNGPDKNNWGKYHELSKDDPPILNMVLLIKLLSKVANICYLTGRTESSRLITSTWLSEHLEYSSGKAELIMRKNDDDRDSSVYKQHMYSEHFVSKGRKVWLVFEDDDSTIRMWRELGLTCLPPIASYASIPGLGSCVLSQSEVDALLKGISGGEFDG